MHSLEQNGFDDGGNERDGDDDGDEQSRGENGFFCFTHVAKRSLQIKREASNVHTRWQLELMENKAVETIEHVTDFY